MRVDVDRRGRLSWPGHGRGRAHRCRLCSRPGSRRRGARGRGAGDEHRYQCRTGLRGGQPDYRAPQIPHKTRTLAAPAMTIFDPLASQRPGVPASVTSGYRTLCDLAKLRGANPGHDRRVLSVRTQRERRRPLGPQPVSRDSITLRERLPVAKVELLCGGNRGSHWPDDEDVRSMSRSVAAPYTNPLQVGCITHRAARSARRARPRATEYALTRPPALAAPMCPHRVPRASGWRATGVEASPAPPSPRPSAYRPVADPRQPIPRNTIDSLESSHATAGRQATGHRR